MHFDALLECSLREHCIGMDTEQQKGSNGESWGVHLLREVGNVSIEATELLRGVAERSCNELDTDTCEREDDGWALQTSRFILMFIFSAPVSNEEKGKEKLIRDLEYVDGLLSTNSTNCGRVRATVNVAVSILRCAEVYEAWYRGAPKYLEAVVAEKTVRELCCNRNCSFISTSDSVVLLRGEDKEELWRKARSAFSFPNDGGDDCNNGCYESWCCFPFRAYPERRGYVGSPADYRHNILCQQETIVDTYREYQEQVKQSCRNAAAFLDDTFWKTFGGRHLVAAGGSVCNTLRPFIRDAEWTSKDVDLFILSPPSDDSNDNYDGRDDNIRITALVDDVVRYVSTRAKERGLRCFVFVSQHAVNINVDRPEKDGTYNDERVTIQIVLRLIRSVEELLCAFDLHPCRVAFDGRTFFLARSAAWCMQKRMFVPEPESRSSSLKRVAKYNYRGFICGLPRTPRQDELLYAVRNELMHQYRNIRFYCGVRAIMDATGAKPLGIVLAGSLVASRRSTYALHAQHILQDGQIESNPFYGDADRCNEATCVVNIYEGLSPRLRDEISRPGRIKMGPPGRDTFDSSIDPSSYYRVPCADSVMRFLPARLRERSVFSYRIRSGELDGDGDELRDKDALSFLRRMHHL